MNPLTTIVIGMMLMYSIKSWKLCCIRMHHPLLQSIAWDLWKQFVSGLLDRTVIIQLGCPELADIRLARISCTFACHRYKHVCALRTASSLAQWLNFYTLSVQYAKCPPQPAFIDVFLLWSLLPRTYFLNEQEIKYVSTYRKWRMEILQVMRY